MTRPQHPRAHELLADRALYGLDDAEAHELRALGADADDSYDLAAAAIDLATLPAEPMPDAVAERVLAARHPRTLAGWEVPAPQPTAPPSLARSSTPLPFAPVSSPPPIAQPSGTQLPVTQPPIIALPATRAVPPVPIARRRRPVVSLLAAAATLAVVAGAWWLLRGRDTSTTSPQIALTPAQARAELLAGAADATRLDWRPTPEAPSASGDVVWSATAQRGYMRFVGLPANDPARAQYQLWIFDRLRDEAYPVDGGVFDVSSTGEIVVPIHAKLRVDDATLFAVTVERPGGVVVSRREHIVVTAARS